MMIAHLPGDELYLYHTVMRYGRSDTMIISADAVASFKLKVNVILCGTIFTRVDILFFRGVRITSLIYM